MVALISLGRPELPKMVQGTVGLTLEGSGIRVDALERGGSTCRLNLDMDAR